MSYVTLASTPIQFEPQPPGAQRPSTLSTGFTNQLVLYKKGAGGPNRMMCSESYGYSTLDISNPMNPTALIYDDNRFSSPHITTGGDGQNDVYSFAVSDDGQRAAFSLGGPADSWYTVAGSSNQEGFKLQGSFPPKRSGNVIIQHVNGRYLCYASVSNVSVADITNFPSSFTQRNITTEATGWTGGNLTLSGNFITYLYGPSLIVVNASNPGPIGSITSSMPTITLSSTDFGGRTPQYITTALDPNDSSKLWVLVELHPLVGENSPSFCLVSVTSNFVKTVGLIWRVPSVSGQVFTFGFSNALVVNNNKLFALMWSNQYQIPEYKLYSTTTDDWSNINTTSMPGVFTIPSGIPGFTIGHIGGCLSVGNNIYMYLPTTPAAFIIPMTCVTTGGSVTVPAAPTGLGVSKINNTTVRLSWTPPV